MKRMMYIAAVMTLLLPRMAAAQQCLHGADESDEQKARRRAAVGATREVNNVQANRPEARSGLYLDQAGMASAYEARVQKTGAAARYNFDPAAEILPGWQLTLNKTDNGYWFMIKDKTDPCGFAYISNQAGLIYTAEPIR
jgi:hypothetical protein